MKSHWAFLVLCSAATALVAAEPTRAQLDFFENKIRPLLMENCYKCHSATSEKVKGGLLLDSREGWTKGGKSGPALVPGFPEKSLLIEAVKYTNEELQMPPKGERLSAIQIADLVRWVKMGAPDPRTKPTITLTANDRNHWSFQPVKKPAAPIVKQQDWIVTPVDAFILAGLEAKGMKPSRSVDKRTLLRRATFDLTGLPPTPQEVTDFLADSSPGAYAQVIERLLKSPHYGERWGRYWLDTARYADTKGEVKKRREDFRYPFAWTYRDYVIDAFNQDKPYNHFIIEQIAADKLPPGNNPTNLAALGFLTLGNRFDNNKNDIINDRIDVVTKGFLGLTVSCARCHDHKFDPVPTQDYYSLYGVFNSSREPAIAPLLNIPEPTPEYLDYQKQRTDLANEQKLLEAQFKELRGKKDVNRQARLELQRKVAQLQVAIARLEITHEAAPPRAMVLEDDPRAGDSRVFLRGEAENKGEVAPRRFLEILSGPNRPLFRNGSGRLELAQAIASKDNPLTARVMVNRVWLHHFGEGLVTTPDDFGNNSEPPAHPELLDFLATAFMEHGWSVKQLHRLIMLSSTYQQSSANNPRYAQMDPDNRLLWRANIRRLEFEALRDSVLAIGGKLDLGMGGRPVNLGREPYSTRRTIYGTVDRNDLPEVMNHFDFANPDMTTGKRYETTVPQQALFLMNSPLVVEQAKSLVRRSDFTSMDNETARIQLLYDLVYQRPPRAEEIELGVQFLAQEPSQERVTTTGAVAVANRPNRKPAPPAKQRLLQGKKATFRTRDPLTGWEEYAHALLQTSETSFVH